MVKNNCVFEPQNRVQNKLPVYTLENLHFEFFCISSLYEFRNGDFICRPTILLVLLLFLNEKLIQNLVDKCLGY